MLTLGYHAKDSIQLSSAWRSTYAESTSATSPDLLKMNDHLHRLLNPVFLPKAYLSFIYGIELTPHSSPPRPPLFCLSNMFKAIQSSATRQLRYAKLPSKCPSSYTTRTYASNRDTTPFDWKDPLGAHKNLFTEEELDIAETAESYCQERLLPRVLGMTLFLFHRYHWHVRHSHPLTVVCVNHRGIQT